MLSRHARQLTTVAAICITAISTAGASPDPGRQGVAAIVNGEEITIADLQAQCRAAAGSAATRQLIDDTLIVEATQSHRIHISQSDIDARKADLQKDLGGQSLAGVLQQHDTSPAVFDEGLRSQMELERLVTTPIQPARHMRHVWHATVAALYMDPKTNKLRTRSPKDIQAILAVMRAKLAAGAKFSDVARRYSDYAATQQSGGDLGILYQGTTYYPNLYPPASGMRPGEYSKQTIQSPAGYEVIYVSSTAEKHPAAENALYAQAARGYRQQQLGDDAQLVLQALRKKAVIVRYADTDIARTGIAARVNGTPITESAVEARALDTAGPSLLRHLVESKLIDQAARSQNITVTPNDIAVKKAELVSRLAGVPLADALRKQGMTMQDLESNLADQVKVEKLSHIAAKPATHMRRVFHIAVAAQDAGPYAGDAAASALPGRPPAPTREEALAKLQMIQDKFKAGESFQDLAKEYSDDIFSQRIGGDLGILHDGTQVNRDILKVALSLNKGDVSAPFKSFFGYDIVYIESTEEDHPAAEDALYSQADSEYRDSQTDVPIQQILQSLEQKGKVTIYFHA